MAITPIVVQGNIPQTRIRRCNPGECASRSSGTSSPTSCTPCTNRPTRLSSRTPSRPTRMAYPMAEGRGGGGRATFPIGRSTCNPHCPHTPTAPWAWACAGLASTDHLLLPVHSGRPHPRGLPSRGRAPARRAGRRRLLAAGTAARPRSAPHLRSHVGRAAGVAVGLATAGPAATGGTGPAEVETSASGGTAAWRPLWTRAAGCGAPVHPCRLPGQIWRRSAPWRRARGLRSATASAAAAAAAAVATGVAATGVAAAAAEETAAEAAARDGDGTRGREVGTRGTRTRLPLRRARRRRRTLGRSPRRPPRAG
jgi:hypothetical protein